MPPCPLPCRRGRRWWLKVENLLNIRWVTIGAVAVVLTAVAFTALATAVVVGAHARGGRATRRTQVMPSTTKAMGGGCRTSATDADETTLHRLVVRLVVGGWLLALSLASGVGIVGAHFVHTMAGCVDVASWGENRPYILLVACLGSLGLVLCAASLLPLLRGIRSERRRRADGKRPAGPPTSPTSHPPQGRPGAAVRQVRSESPGVALTPQLTTTTPSSEELLSAAAAAAASSPEGARAAAPAGTPAGVHRAPRRSLCRLCCCVNALIAALVVGSGAAALASLAYTAPTYEMVRARAWRASHQPCAHPLQAPPAATALTTAPARDQLVTSS